MKGLTMEELERNSKTDLLPDRIEMRRRRRRGGGGDECKRAVVNVGTINVVATKNC